MIQPLKIMNDFSELKEQNKEEIHKKQNWLPAWLWWKASLIDKDPILKTRHWMLSDESLIIPGI